MKYIYTYFMIVFLVPLTPYVNAPLTGNGFNDALNNTSSEIEGYLSNTTQTAPSIGDALTTSSSVSNDNSSQETKPLNNTSSEIGESIDNTTQDRPSIGDALTTSSSISNNTNLE